MVLMKDRLSHFQATILIFMTQSGVVIFSLPRLLAQHFGTNGWIALLLVFASVSLSFGLFTILFRLSNGSSILAIMERVIPKVLLYPFYIFLILTWGLIGSLVAKQYVLIFQMIAFPTTNPMLFKLAVDILAFLLLTKGLYNISKAATIFFWMSIWVIVFLIFSFNDFHWVRLTPFVFQGSVISIHGFVSIFSAFLGYELSLLFTPYVDKKTKLVKSAFLGNLFLTLNYMFISIIAFGFFSLDQLKDLTFPLITLMSYIHLPFVQGIENLLYGIFLFTSVLTTVMYYWSAKEVSKRVLPISDVLIGGTLIFIFYVISYIPKDIMQVQMWLYYLTFTGIAISYGLPILVIVLILVTKSGRDEVTVYE